MRIVRNSIFETNSSSTHALAIMKSYNTKKFHYLDCVLDEKGVCYFSKLGSNMPEMLVTPYEKVRYLIGLVAAYIRSSVMKKYDYDAISVSWLTRNKQMRAFLDRVKKILAEGGYNVTRFDFTSIRDSKIDDMYGDFGYCGGGRFETDKTVIWNDINHEVVEMVEFTGIDHMFDNVPLEDVILRDDIGIYYWFNG